MDDEILAMARKALSGDATALVRLIGSVRADLCGDKSAGLFLSLEERVRQVEFATSQSLFLYGTFCSSCWGANARELDQRGHNCSGCGREMRRPVAPAEPERRAVAPAEPESQPPLRCRRCMATSRRECCC